ncbi:MAG: leucine-rich repeat domain-containing protein, partial [Muribaculaceae bacterium]|nr:leucine-rich repeat domain-containing protein [Muribaculaceae bacterium]
LRTVIVPSTVKRIDDHAFAGCRQLNDVGFVGNPELGAGILKDCVSLTFFATIVGLTDIPASMFDGCSSYAIPPSADVVSVGDCAYRGTAVERLELLRVERLGDFCFADMPSLCEVNIDLSHDLEVGTGAFFNDGALGMLPAWPGDIPGLALAYSRGRQKEAIQSEVIGQAAYANNTDIGYVKLGSGVRRIDAHAFRNLTALEQVDVTDLGTLMPDVDPLAFSGLENGEGRYDIILNVAKETNDDWAGHPVWGLFKINNMDTGIVDIPGSGPHDMTVSREGMSVSVVSSLPVDYLGVFALDGTVIHESRPGTEKCEVYLPDGPDVLIVRAVSGTLEKVVKLR